MFATIRVTPLPLCLFASGACRKSLTPKSTEAAGRGPVIDSMARAASTLPYPSSTLPASTFMA
jgi:hypothetical protein